MKVEDTLQFGMRALTGFRTRTWLMLLAMAIGVGSVVVLSSLGDGARRYVTGEFAELGTHLLIVLPGRSETTGGHPPLMGEVPRDLTLQDAQALLRSSAIKQVAPIVVGSAPVSVEQLEREIMILGATPELYPIRHLELSRGKFLPAGDVEQGAAVAVLGSKVKRELFGNRRALGEWVRIGDRRFRVIGILKDKGQSLGTDISDVAIIPVATAQALFDQPSLFRILVQAKGPDAAAPAEQAIIDIIRQRHDGEDDVTVITQDAVLATFDGIFRALTLTVVGIAAISLGVAGILIMNVMLVAVSQRTPEIGLLKALGAPQKQILRLFLMEAALLSLLGAALGVVVSLFGVWALGRAFPDFPFEIPLWAVGASVGVALGTGLLFGVLPARKAARLDPVEALSRR
jgi:putative ABC transport system permease protein